MFSELVFSESILQPDWPGLPSGIGAACTTRRGGLSLPPYDDGQGGGGFNLGDHVADQPGHVQHNRAMLAAQLPAPVQWLSQVHGTRVLDVGAISAQDSREADACLTSQSGVVCAVLTADCLPVLFCDATHGVVAAAHAGWRGLADGVLENTVAAMLQSGAKTDHIMAWLGPAIGPSAFEVGSDVRARFVALDSQSAPAFADNPARPGHFYADLAQLARLRLYRCGIRQISGGGWCTVSHPEKFYSYRRDGVTGRMASLIWLKK